MIRAAGFAGMKQVLYRWRYKALVSIGKIDFRIGSHENIHGRKVALLRIYVSTGAAQLLGLTLSAQYGKAERHINLATTMKVLPFGAACVGFAGNTHYLQ